MGGNLQAGDDLDALPTPLAFPTDSLALEQLRQEMGPHTDLGLH